MSTINVLFFSNNCHGSQTLITLLKNEGLLRFFHTICTDSNPNIPPAITVTPTIIIRGNATPYVAGDAFVWMNKIKQWKINEQMKRVSSMQQQYLQGMAGNLGMNTNTLNGTGMENVLGFSQEEMSGMSDIFAYLMDDSAIQHTYFDCVNLGKEMIYTAPQEKKKETEEERQAGADRQKHVTAKLENDRKKQDKEFKKNIEDFRKQFS